MASSKDRTSNVKDTWPKYNANCISYMTNYWANKYAKIKHINPNYIDNLHYKEQSNTLSDKFLKYWYHNKNKNPLSLFYGIIKVFGLYQFIGVIIFSCFVNILAAVMFILLYFIFEFLFDSSKDNNSYIEYYVIAAIIVIMLRLGLINHPRSYAVKFGHLSQGLMQALILKKSLTINSNRLETGYIINLISADTNKLGFEFWGWIFQFISFILAVLIFISVMAFTSGNYWIFNGLSIIIIVFITSAIAALKFSLYRSITLKYTDERLKITKEMIFGWITTKMNGWELPIYNLINNIRNNELNIQSKSNTMKILIQWIMFINLNLICLAIYLPSMYLMPQNISIAQLFSVVAFFGAIGYEHFTYLHIYICICKLNRPRITFVSNIYTDGCGLCGLHFVIRVNVNVLIQGSCCISAANDNKSHNGI